MRELFADYLEGGFSEADSERAAMALGEHLPSTVAHNAIEKSLEAFGYGSNACTFVSLMPIDAQREGGDIPLDAQALFLLIEGLDPLHIIACDTAATTALAQAYRTHYNTDAPIRVFGRSSAAFSDLDALLQTPAGKQTAWRVLKSFQTL